MIELQLCTDKEQWNDFVLDNEGHPLQLWGWGQVKAGHGWTALRFFALQDEEVVGGAQVLIRKLPAPLTSLAYIPRGPITISREFNDEFLSLIATYVKKEHKSVALTIEPHDLDFRAGAGWKRTQNKILSSDTILLNLQHPESELLAAMAKKTRQYIRKSAADGIQIKRVTSPADVQECLHIYEQTSRRAGFNTHSDQYYKDVQVQMGEHAPLFAAYVDGSPVAFLWMAVSADIAYELYGGMNEDGQRLRANYALKWHVIRKMKEWGLSEYDFGGLVAGGVSNFKQGWTDDITVLPGTFDYPLSPLYPVWNKALPSAKKIVQSVKKRFS